MNLSKIHHIAIIVSDYEAAKDFYMNKLGLLALGNIKGEVVDRPKALGDIRGMTYIYGMFYRFGLIDVPDEVKAKMGHPKNHKKKRNLIDGSEHILYDRLKKDEK